MPPKAELQYINLSDFTPGIKQQYLSSNVGEPHQDGAAQSDQTWGCVALPGGGLAPLPRHTIERQGITFLGEDGDNDNFEWPAGERRIVMLDMKPIGPISYIPPYNQTVLYDTPATDVAFIRQAFVRRLNTNSIEPLWFFQMGREYRGDTEFRNPATHMWVYDLTSPALNIIPNRRRWGNGSIAQTRTARAGGDPFQIGAPITVIAMGGPRVMGGINDSDTQGQDIFKYLTYPNVRNNNFEDQGGALTPTLGGTVWTPSSVVFGHQGRLMGLAAQSGWKYMHRFVYHGDENAYMPASEVILYWPVNDAHASAKPEYMTVGEEHSTGYGTVCSVSADSLFLVKHAGGAVQINGDIENPSVVTIPGIPSTGGISSRGVMTKAGFVYGTRMGVWAWTGSDTAEPLSLDLKQDFWVPEDPTVPAHGTDTPVGSFGYRHPFVFAPNNWVMDLRTNSWWRYAPTPEQDPGNGITYAFNEVDAQGNLWAAVKSYVEPGVMYRMYPPNGRGVRHYRWQSQPLARTQHRYLDYRNITVVAAGWGRVTVTLRGIDGEEAVAVLDVASNRVAQIEAPIHIHTTDVEVTIDSRADEVVAAAPTVHRVHLGFQEAQSIDQEGRIRG